MIQITKNMPNKNYVKGRNKEYKIVHALRSDGFDIAQRTAGSHSPIDIIAINRLTKVIKFVQAKPESMSQNQKDKIELENNWLNNVFRCEFEVI